MPRTTNGEADVVACLLFEGVLLEAETALVADVIENALVEDGEARRRVRMTWQAGCVRSIVGIDEKRKVRQKAADVVRWWRTKPQLNLFVPPPKLTIPDSITLVYVRVVRNGVGC